MLLVKISLYWLLPLNHVSERLNSLEGIIYQKKSHQRKTLKGKTYSTFTHTEILYSTIQNTHVNVKMSRRN